MKRVHLSSMRLGGKDRGTSVNFCLVGLLGFENARDP